MQLSGVTIGLLLVAAVAGFAALVIGHGRPGHAAGAQAVRNASVVLAAGMFACLAFRDPSFGADTHIYADLFVTYCRDGIVSQDDRSFEIALAVLNIMMLGACERDFVPAAWAAAICVPLLLGGDPVASKVRYGALFLVSMVGLELTTNALRQGLSAACLIAAASYWTKHKVIAAGWAAVAVVLHLSTVMVLAATGAAALPWLGFIAVLAGTTVVVLDAVNNGSVVGFFQPLERLVFEITKYQGHEAQEIWIRVLAMASVVATVAAPFIAARGRNERHQLWRNSWMQRGLRLAFSVLPFVMVPYLGYRYVYGVFPLVLWLVLRGCSETQVRENRTFAWVLVGNAMVVLAWALGSTQMRSVHFLST